MRTVDAILSIPSLLFALLIVTLLGQEQHQRVLAIGIAFTPGMARITRSVALAVAQAGLRQRRHRARRARRLHRARARCCPNVIAPIIVEMTIRVAFAVMLFATLSFLGLGAQPPVHGMGADGRRGAPLHVSATRG